AWDILKILDMAGTRVASPSYPAQPASMFRHLSYPDIWKTCYQNQYYHFQLSDGSLIQFRVENYKPLEVSYVFYDCPYKAISLYDNFREEYADLIEDEHELREEYTNYFAQLELKDSWVPLRYDYSPELYSEGRHPASHVHFGHNNNIRVGTKKLLMPISFLHFVLRQMYPDAWAKLVTMEYAELWCRNIREVLVDIDSRYWRALDEWEMYLL